MIITQKVGTKNWYTALDTLPDNPIPYTSTQQNRQAAFMEVLRQMYLAQRKI